MSSNTRTEPSRYNTVRVCLLECSHDNSLSHGHLAFHLSSSNSKAVTKLLLLMVFYSGWLLSLLAATQPRGPKASILLGYFLLKTCL